MSPMQWETAHIPLASGMQQKADPRALEAPNLAVCLNAEFDEVGGLQKRKPYTAKAGTVPSNARRLAVYDGELLLFTDTKLYSYSDAESDWVEVAEYLAPKVTEQPRFVRMPDQVECDHAELGGVTVYSWRDNGGESYLAALDSETGALLVAPTAIDNGGNSLQKVRLVALNSRIVCMAYDPTAGDVLLKMLLPTNLDSSTAGEGFSGAWQGTYGSSTGCFDVQPSAGDFGGFVVGNGTDYTVGNITGGSSGSPTLSTATHVYAAAGAIAVAKLSTGGSRVVILRAQEGKVDVVSGSVLTTTVSMDNTTVAADVGREQCSATWLDSSTCSLWLSKSVPADGTAITYTNTVDTSGTTSSGNAITLRMVNLASHAFAYDGAAFAWCSRAPENTVAGASGAEAVGFRGALQNTYFLMRADNTPTAKSATQRGGGHQSEGHLASVSSSSADVYDACLGESRRIPLGDEASEGYAQRNPLVVQVEFDSDDARRLGQSGRTLYMAGGQVSQFDGEALAEVGFGAYPSYLNIAAVGSGGSLSAGDYAYKSSYRWDNAKGEVERSTSATVGLVTTVASDQVNIYTNCLLPTLKKGSVTSPAVEYWRTVVNPTTNAPFYLITDPDPSNTSSTNGYVENDATAYTPGISADDLSDSDLTKNETYPENSGRLPNIAPPAATVILAGEERVYLAGIAGAPNTVWYSMLRAEGEIAAFSDFLTVTVPADGGAITALAFLQDVLVVFKERAIYTLPGDGYDNIGGGQNYGPARLLSSDVGAQSAEAVGVTPNGVVFRSDRGWHRLNKGFQVEYIGANVCDYDSDALVAVHVMPSQHQVRIVSTSRILVWDTLVEQWSEWEESGIVGSVVRNGTHTILTSSDCSEQSSSYTGTAYSLDVETAWLKMAGLGGFYRARRVGVLGEFRSAHDLQVRVAYGYDPDWIDDVTHDVTSVATGEPIKEQQRITRQKTDAIKVRITDKNSSGGTPSAEGIKLTGLSLEYGIKRGMTRLPATQKQ